MRSIVLTVTAAGMALVACSDPPPPPPATPPPPPAAIEPDPATRMVVLEKKGKVEQRRDEAWRELAIGDNLETNDAIRTEAGGSVALQVGDSARVVVEENSEATVREITKTVANFKLQRGLLTADVKNDSFTMRVEAKDTDTVAVGRKGSFTVFTDGHGAVAVASTAGGVKLTTSSGDLDLAAGERANVSASGRSAKVAIPKSVFLKVAWPEARASRATKMTVRGKVEVGTKISIPGARVNVKADGSFVAHVPLKTGANDLTVVARDMLGRETRDARTIDVRRTAPNAEVEADELWE